MASNGLRAISYQVTLKLVRGKTLEYATNPAITYTGCYSPFFLIFNCLYCQNIITF